MTATRNDTAAPVAQPQEPTYIDIVLDETGSMGACKNATIAGFNGFVEEQRKIEGQCYLTLTKFDTQGIRTPYQNLALDMVPPLSFHPGAGTNLYDTVGDRITALMSQKRNGRSLLVVITDGENTHSVRHTAATVSRLLGSALEAGLSVLYFGAGRRARETGLAMGFPENTITAFEVLHEEEMAQTMNFVSAQTTAFRAA